MSDVTAPEPTEPVASTEPVISGEDGGPGPETVDDDPVGYLDTAADPWAAV